jgi:hypothetical protein
MIFHLSGERELRRPEILHLLLLSFLPNKQATLFFYCTGVHVYLLSTVQYRVETGVRSNQGSVKNSFFT